MDERNWIGEIGVRSYLRISHLDLKPRRVNTITGDNESGKSSFLKSIREVFVSSGVDPDKISTNAEKAVIEIELPVGTFTRKLTRRSNTLAVDGDVPEETTPAKWAKSLAEGTLWDPITFFQLGQTKTGRREQRNMLLEMIAFRIDKEAMLQYAPLEILDDINFDQHGMLALEEIRTKVYDLRKTVNVRKVEKEKAHTAELSKLPDGFTPVDVDTDTLNDKLQAAMAHNRLIDAANDAIVEKKREHARLKSQRDEILTRIEQLTAQASEVEGRAQIVEGEIDKAHEERIGLGPRIETDPIMADIRALTQIQRFVGISELAKEHQAEAARLGKQHKKLDTLHKRLKDEIPAELMRELSMPIEGLTFDEERVYVDGYAMENLSTGRQLRIAFELAARNGRDETGLDFILVDNLEALGDALREEVFDIIRNDEQHQYFVAERTEGPLHINTEDTV